MFVPCLHWSLLLTSVFLMCGAVRELTHTHTHKNAHTLRFCKEVERFRKEGRFTQVAIAWFGYVILLLLSLSLSYSQWRDCTDNRLAPRAKWNRKEWTKEKKPKIVDEKRKKYPESQTIDSDDTQILYLVIIALFLPRWCVWCVCVLQCSYYRYFGNGFSPHLLYRHFHTLARCISISRLAIIYA